MIQGMSITNKNEFLFTASYTNLINSTLYRYKDVTKGNQKTITIKNKNVPYYEFKNNDLISIVAIKFHLAEGMFYYDGYAYIMFENSSSKYFFAEPKINNVLKYKIS